MSLWRHEQHLLDGLEWRWNLTRCATWYRLDGKVPAEQQMDECWSTNYNNTKQQHTASRILDIQFQIITDIIQVFECCVNIQTIFKNGSKQ